MTASATVTLGLPKPGLLIGDGPRFSGEVLVADIGIPFEAYAAVGVQVPSDLFSVQDCFHLSAFQKVRSSPLSPTLPREPGVPTKSRRRGADFVGWEGGGRTT